MKYVGSKRLHAKEIIATIFKQTKNIENFKWWVEPFVGGANVISKVNSNIFTTKIGIDINGYVITMLNRLINETWVPPINVSEDEYISLKNLYKNDYPIYGEKSPDIAFAAICCSFGGKWWGGYARGKTNKGEDRNYAKEAHHHLMKQKKELSDCVFIVNDYNNIKLSRPSLIYCDPPYKNTTKYDFIKNFDHEYFWSWCDDMYNQGHAVFVSEYDAPEGWECVWRKTNVNSSLTQDTGSKKSTEKLFYKVK